MPNHIYFTFGISLIALSQAALLIRLSEAPAEIVGFWRMIFTLPLLGILFLIGKQKLSISYLKKHKIQIGLAGFLFFLHFWFWFYAVNKTTIATAMIIFNLNPIFVALGSTIFFKEKLSFNLIIALTLGLVGLIVLQKGVISFDTTQGVGNLLALFAAIAFAGYLLTTKSLRAHTSNLALTLCFNISCLIGFSLSSLALGRDFINYPLQSWLSFFALAAIPSLLGHSLFTYSLKHMKASYASAMKLIEPVIAAMSAQIVFGEGVEFHTVLGFIVIIIGLLQLLLGSRFSIKFR